MSTLEGNLDGGVLTNVSGGAVQDLDPQGAGSSTGIVAHRWLLGAKLYLNSGTQYVADDFIRTDAALYFGEVLDFGFIDRSIDAPAAPCRIGDCLLRLKDTDQKWRILLSTQTGIRRLIEIVRITDDAVIGGFEIVPGGVTFGEGFVEVRGSDIMSRILKKKIPMLGTRANFPWMAEGVDEFFMNIVVGNQFSSGDNPQGMVPCRRMGPTTRGSDSPSIAVDRYSVSRARVNISSTPAVVYRRLSSESEFGIVDSGEYTLTQGEIFTDNNQSYLPTYLDFYENQEADAEIRIDTLGAERIPAFGGIDIHFLTDDSTANPMDAFAVVMFEAIAANGAFHGDRYSESSFIETSAAFAAASYRMDFCLSQQITYSDFVAWWQSCTEADFYINRHYQLEVALVLSEDTARDVLTDTRDFISVMPEPPRQAYNQFKYRYDLVPATGEFTTTAVYDNAADQAELGDVDYQSNSDQIEILSVDLPLVKDTATALSVITRRSALQALGSFRVTFVVSTPEWFERFELATLIGVTHYGGITASGGWVNKEFKILSIRHDLRTLQTTVHAILREPATY